MAQICVLPESLITAPIRLDTQSDLAVFNSAIPVVPIRVMTAISEDQRHRRGIGRIALARWNGVLSPPQRDGYFAPQSNGITFCRRSDDDCGNSWHNDCWLVSPVGEPCSPLGPSKRTLIVLQARWESRHLRTDAGRKSQFWPGASVHGVDTGLITPLPGQSRGPGPPARKPSL